MKKLVPVRSPDLVRFKHRASSLIATDERARAIMKARREGETAFFILFLFFFSKFRGKRNEKKRREKKRK